LARSPYAFLGLSFEIALPVLLLLFAGYWLDGRLGTEPWLMVLGAVLGMGVGFYSLVRRVASGPRDGDE
jgi:F0F1-type ATP synthase assembly protein I